MSEADDYSAGTEEQIRGSSFESFEDAIKKALRDNPGSENRRVLNVSLEVEEGGVVGRPQFHVMLNPQPLPPGPDR